MNDFRTVSQSYVGADANVDAGLRAHMQRVYGLMASAMVLTGLVAYWVGNNAALMSTLFTGPIRWLVMFLPLIMIFAFGAAVSRLSANGARLFFYAFAAAMGLSIAWIFAVYTTYSIFATFLYTAVGFLALSLWGYTTKKDISAWGSFLIMGVVGLIIASIVNIFLGSSGLDFVISVLGVLIFAGLTAYDTQNIKNIYLQMRNSMGESAVAKLAIHGALQLYLDFINMFMFLLRFLGSQE